jgi:F0F1-type ATP synthase epsilon subunit
MAQQKPKEERDQRLQVKVFSPYQVFYEGPADSLSGVNRTGPFDVLMYHANFFSLLAPGDIVVNTGYQALKFPIARGIIRVFQNRAIVFVDV